MRRLGGRVKLGLNLGYWGSGNDADNLTLAQEADRLGYSVVWAAEAYGSDAATVLAWVAAQTTRIDVGSAIFQIPGRTPANTAMTAATLLRARVTAAPGLAPLLVLGELVEAAVFGILIDFRAAQLIAAGHDVDRCLFAALELANDRIDDPLIEKGL